MRSITLRIGYSWFRKRSKLMARQLGSHIHIGTWSMYTECWQHMHFTPVAARKFAKAILRMCDEAER